jgi:hypothetical protein
MLLFPDEESCFSARYRNYSVPTDELRFTAAEYRLGRAERHLDLLRFLTTNQNIRRVWCEGGLHELYFVIIQGT